MGSLETYEKRISRRNKGLLGSVFQSKFSVYFQKLKSKWKKKNENSSKRESGNTHWCV